MILQKDGRLYKLEEDEKEYRLIRLPASKAHIFIVLAFLVAGIWLLETPLITLGVVWALYVYVFPKRSFRFEKANTKVQDDGKHVIFVVGKKSTKFKKFK